MTRASACCYSASASARCDAMCARRGARHSVALHTDTRHARADPPALPAAATSSQAPDAATRTEADQFLQSFRSSVRPYALCTLLLQSEGASPAVQFVALATMKEALRREGRLLGSAQLQQLKEQLLQLVVARVHQWVRALASTAQRAKQPPPQQLSPRHSRRRMQ